MELKEYRRLYDKVSLPKEADERILQTLTEKLPDSGAGRKRKRVWIAGAAVVAVFILAVEITHFLAATSAEKDVVSRLNDLIKNEPESVEGIDYGYPTSSYIYSDDTEYLMVDPDAPKKACKMDSLEEVSDVLGLDLLQSKDAHEQADCMQYTPDVSDSGLLSRINIQDVFYVLGDVREPEIKVYKDKDNTISYREGKNYHSPIRMEITIMTSRELEEDVVIEGEGREDVTIHKLGNGGLLFNSMEKEDGALSTLSQEVYLIENLGVDAVLSSASDVPGDDIWNKQDGEELSHLVEAYFVYAGVEYRYTGDVSVKTMQEFLEGLEIF